MKDLQDIRKEIDRIDDQIVALYEADFGCGRIQNQYRQTGI